MTPREERGLVLAATAKMIQKGKVWLVPSQNGSGKYTVSPDPDCPYCSCPDHAETGEKCKHLYAVEIVMRRDTAKDGTITETRSLTFTEKKVYRKPSQPVFDLAQREEKSRFIRLLADLCSTVVSPPANKVGRRRTPMADMVFATVLKVYSTISARRFNTDLEQAADAGHLAKRYHPLMVCRFLENDLLEPYLKSLISVSAKPLKAIEHDFAVDSSGFSTSRFTRWYDEKYGVTRVKNHWIKTHICCGVRTHVVTAVEILEKDSADCPQFKPLVAKTAENFDVREVSADKAYLSRENIEAVFEAGGTPYIAFKENSTGSSGGLFQKMFHLYSLNRETYMNHYHKRSNVESVFSMVKAKMGDNVRSKTDVAMRNEVLCKLLAHNLCCLIMSQVELGIDPAFSREPVKETAPKTIIADRPSTPSPKSEAFDLADFRFSD